jgi:hypothetical protein
MWLCACQCGAERAVRQRSLLSGVSTSCGCRERVTVQPLLNGTRFGRLVVVSDDGGPVNDKRLCVCACDCGAEKRVSYRSLKRGATGSCGCLGREIASKRSRKHGLTGTPEYRCWHAMIARCRDPHAAGFEHYGGRGIRVCDQWQSFEGFLADMGPRPTLNHSIDRIDGTRGYEPGNCRWATTSEQARNRNNNVVIEFRGQSRTLVEWCEELGLREPTIRSRRRRGERDPELLFGPPRKACASNG